MPTIKSSTDLRNHYNDISTLCHESTDPVFITKNGRGDLAVMSISTYQSMKAKLELYSLLADGERDLQTGQTRTLDEVFNDLIADNQ